MGESGEWLVDVGGVELCVGVTGRGGDPAVLLVAGTSCSMDWWPAEFCAELAGRGLFVIRFDQRDTGRARQDPPGAPAYGLPELVGDAVGVLDAVGVQRACWVGFSQGGWVSQLAALDHPSRVGSLVLISTRATGHGQADADLPEVSPRLLEAWASAGDEPDWSDDDAVLDYLVAGERSLAGPLFDEASVREVCRSFLRRTGDVRAALTNHPMADQGPRWRERLPRVTAPTLVLHGEQDPLFPPANAVRLAAEIPGARLRMVPEVGHELPRKAWSSYVDAIAGHVIPR